MAAPTAPSTSVPRVLEDALGLAEPEPAAEGVRGNARLTAMTGLVLLLLLAAEGVTVPFTGPLRKEHVFLGLLLVPPVALKMGSTGWKIFCYYSGDPAYVLAGAPPWWRRVLGPLVVVATVAVLATGVGLIVIHPRPAFLGEAHLVSFLVWFPLMTVHVLGHLIRAVRRAGAETRRRPRTRGLGLRASVTVASVALGVPLGILALSWLASSGFDGRR